MSTPGPAGGLHPGAPQGDGVRPKADILFVGVGRMGLPMATHLAGAGHAVTVFDPSDERCRLAAGAGLAVATELPAALAAAALVFSSLPGDGALLSLAAALAQDGRRGSLWVDTSTVSPGASASAATSCAERGVACLRAPVSGNGPMADKALLTVYGSGPAAAWQQVEPLLAAVGPQRIYLGDGEQARYAKLAVNLLVAGTTTMLAEALALGEQGGIAWPRLWDVIEASAAASPVVKAKAPALRAHDYSPTASVTMMQKDLALIRATAQSLGVATPVADLAAAALERAAAAGSAAEDYAVVIRHARQQDA
jgi:3-hydroxyisobutyrate dehydrogenase-like beta-hydroxyacid dehydrogenase